MKRLFLILLFICLPVVAKDNEFQNIFITDVSEVEEYLDYNNMTLKGFAEYIEDSNVIYLKDSDDQFVLNIKKPQKISSKSLVDKHNQIVSGESAIYSKYDSEEYQIKPTNRNSQLSRKSFSIGTNYNNDVDIDYAQFEQTAAIFTKYDSKRFSLKTSYERTLGSTNGISVDKVYIIPELKINEVISLKEIFSQNITYRRKRADFLISISPFAKTKDNRLNLEFGTSHTFDENNLMIKNQLKFNTRFKL